MDNHTLKFYPEPSSHVRRFLAVAADMAGQRPFFFFSRPRQSVEQYECLSGVDPQEVFRDDPNTSSYQDTMQEDRSSTDSIASFTTPTTPSRAPTPSLSRTIRRCVSSSSDTDGEPASPLLGNSGAYASMRDGSYWWWSLYPSSRRRRKREGKLWRTFKKGVRRIVRHPWFPQQPITIVKSFHLPRFKGAQTWSRFLLCSFSQSLLSHSHCYSCTF